MRSKQSKVAVTRDGETRMAFPQVAAQMVAKHGWFFKPERPKVDPDELSLAELKAQIKAASQTEVQEILDAERERDNPRASVVQLCEQQLAS